MAEIENVVVVRFTEPSKAYQALSVLKECDAEGRIALRSAAIVERTPTGELRTPRAPTTSASSEPRAARSSGCSSVFWAGRSASSSAGARAPSWAACSTSIAREKSDEALVALGRAIPPGSTAVIAVVGEPAVEVIDGEMAKLGGEVTRRPVAEVMSELEAAERAADAAAFEARRTLVEEHKVEVKADFDERVGKLKEKLHVS